MKNKINELVNWIVDKEGIKYLFLTVAVVNLAVIILVGINLWPCASTKI